MEKEDIDTPKQLENFIFDTIVTQADGAISYQPSI